jgi:hypothetical protein
MKLSKNTVRYEDLPICNGSNGGPDGTSCRPFGAKRFFSLVTEDELAADEMAQLSNSNGYVVTCTDRQQEDCQQVCTETLTVGCTEARTPNWPSADRHEGKYTHK